MSYAGQTPFEEMLSLPYNGFDARPGLYVKNPFNSWNQGGPMVFMSPTWVERHWGGLFDIDFVAPDGLLEYQSICLMRKPALGVPPRMGMHVVETATCQAFNPNATGRIAQRYDAAQPFLDSYGIETRGPTSVSGWIVLRDDEPECLELLVDGEPVENEPTTWNTGPTYRDWVNTHQTEFSTDMDVSELLPGSYRLTVRITGRKGTTHEMWITLHLQ